MVFVSLNLTLRCSDGVFRLHLYHQLLNYWKVESGGYFIYLISRFFFFLLLIRISGTHLPLICRWAVDAVLTRTKSVNSETHKKRDCNSLFLFLRTRRHHYRNENIEIACDVVQCPSVWFQSNPWRSLPLTEFNLNRSVIRFIRIRSVFRIKSTSSLIPHARESIHYSHSIIGFFFFLIFFFLRLMFQP